MAKKTYHPVVEESIRTNQRLIERARKLSSLMDLIDRALKLDPSTRDYKRYQTLGWGSDSIDCYVTYPHVLADAEDLKRLHAVGFFQKASDPPAVDKSDGETTYTFFHEKFKSATEAVLYLRAKLASDSPSCKRVKVDTKTYTQDIYEVRCDGKPVEIMEGQILPSVTDDSSI